MSSAFNSRDLLASGIGPVRSRRSLDAGLGERQAVQLGQADDTLAVFLDGACEQPGRIPVSVEYDFSLCRRDDLENDEALARCI